MGKRGPAPLPANVHMLKGNPSKKNLAALMDGSRVPVEIPKPPTWLKGSAKKEWKRITVELAKLGLIAQIDRGNITAYCVAWGEFEELQQEIKSINDLWTTTPTSGYKQLSHLAVLRNQARDEMRRFAALFGMSPSDRMRVTATPQLDMFDNKDGDSDGGSSNPADKHFND